MVILTFFMQNQKPLTRQHDEERFLFYKPTISSVCLIYLM